MQIRENAHDAVIPLDVLCKKYNKKKKKGEEAMYQEEIESAAKAALSKSNLLRKNPVGYFLLSALAGMYIGFGILLINTIGGVLNGAACTKIVMGVSFGIALSLVVIAGAELFTGNNLVMAVGVAKKTVSLMDVIKLWIVCYIGNLAGSVLVAWLFHLTNLNEGAVGEFIAIAAAGKMNQEFVPLFVKGILCNILVCVATWCGFRCKSESGKLIMIFWCLFAFITTGFEHSVANMTLLAAALFQPFEQAVSVGGFSYNLLAVTLGNMVGGIVFVMIPYYIAYLKNDK